MLQIRLSKPASESGGGAKSLPPDTVTVACPDHLVLADLPVAKSLGSVNAASLLKTVGRRSRRQLGERVHFCVRCDFPIAIYGRLKLRSEIEGGFCVGDAIVEGSWISIDRASSLLWDVDIFPWPLSNVGCSAVGFRRLIVKIESGTEGMSKKLKNSLDCSRSDSLCYLCDERIQKIQTIKLMEGIFICAAPHCLKSFLKKNEFESHIHENHSDLLHQPAEKDGNISESASARKPAASESTVQAPPRPIFSPSSGSQSHDREDKAHHSQTRDQQPTRPVMQPKPPFTGSIQNHPLEQQSDSNPPPGFERPGMQNRLPQQGFDAQGSLRPDPGNFPDKQQGIMGSSPFPEYPMHMPQPHGFAVPMSSNPGLAPQFGYSQFAPDGAQPFYGAASFEMPRPDSTPPEMGSEQGSLLGFPPGAAGNYPRPWNMGQPVGPFEPAAGQPPSDGFVNAADPQGRAVFFQGDYGRNAGVMPSNLPPPPSSANRGLEGGQNSNSMDTRDSKGILMPQPMSLPPPPPLPHHMSQLQRGGGRHYSGDASHDGQGYGWQHEKRDNFGSSQD
ncbi:hypothetical protein HAX54_045987 [Datura stramonium]|uniref:C2H2-type domain-containing protein n=1 Tax=Datura stramonium TaxID=4076 RepID=A0ABS8RPN3_DATST|nr:hypothetical protein [Datura stramonium]